MRSDEDYFTALDAPRRFGQDRTALESRFYEASRALHPDRFAAADPDARKNSLERMSFLNQAFATLRNREALRDYVMEREGISPPKAAIPMELAEDWFEIQDLLGENVERAHEKLASFETRLREHRAAAEKRIAAGESELDQTGLSRDGLNALARLAQSVTYLVSLERDVERIKGRSK